ncbi:hypothetical protein PAL_GLEAN10020869 [Pteropus alecto]|uniref:Uncharacterized protein n=1 Tax=Pteropus alecto TaxID=9402 RepID=L5JPB7_PTEAL|nr:hypothetical protein PAL_GLEAN10020869 [Pteropus alecto]
MDAACKLQAAVNVGSGSASYSVTFVPPTPMRSSGCRKAVYGSGRTALTPGSLPCCTSLNWAIPVAAGFSLPDLGSLCCPTESQCRSLLAGCLFLALHRKVLECRHCVLTMPPTEHSMVPR